MARIGKPWWWNARGRWAANIDGTRATAPPSIGKNDRISAELWYESKVSAGRPIEAGFTMGELIAEYMLWDSGRHTSTPERGKMVISKRAMFKTLCRTRINHRPLGEHVATMIREEHIEAAVRTWKREQADGKARRSPGYQRKMVAEWKAVWAWAHRRFADRSPVQLLPTNPLAGARSPAAAMVEERYAERKEAAAWLRYLRRIGKREFAMLHRCMILTGARPSEWTRGTWGDIQWGANPMPILLRSDWKAGEATGKPRRVYIPPALARALRRRANGADPDSLMFITPRDRVVWSASNLATTTQRFRRKAIAAGCDFGDDGADRLTCYRWRHTAASTLLMRGVDIATVAELLGTSVLMIQKHYGHLLSGHLAAAALRLASSR